MAVCLRPATWGLSSYMVTLIAAALNGSGVDMAGFTMCGTKSAEVSSGFVTEAAADWGRTVRGWCTACSRSIVVDVCVCIYVITWRA